MRVLSIQVGRPRMLTPTGDGAPWDRRWRTAFLRQPVSGPVRLLREGLEGDRVADRRIHGGPEMALLAYSAGHYPVWRAELGPAREIDRRDSLFDLGASSLDVIRVHGRLQERFGASLSVVDLFRHPSLAELAAHLSPEPGGGR